MSKNKRLFQYLIFCIVFSLFSVIANAQSKSVKAALENADDLFSSKKHTEALAIYLQQATYLTDLQQYQAGVCYFASGKENAASYTEAVSWFRKASDRGNTVAMHSISYCYGNGYGVPKDTVQQVNWMKKLAGLGDASGMVDMGYRYEHGRGVPLDKKIAEELYKKAFDKGSKEAGYYLGLIRYNENNGVQAIYYLTKAADGGHAACNAQIRAGI